jgi:serine/threonine protein kinase
MTLNTGDTLGPYEILGRLGEGGMGVVYRARDTRLRRDVAVKLLPEAFAQDENRRARFTQEARALAALNHPNILTVYDVGDNYMVTELVEGSTLRGAQLPPRKSFDACAQVADGLAAAHLVGIYHRDLKPDNVMLTRDGRVKILDFGLARQAPIPEDSPTLTALGTDPGAVMGTVGYMSPEQVKGVAADGRSDIFSLGVMLYELLAGKRPFQGDTAVEAMNAILKSDAAPLPDGAPSGAWRLIERCLAKQPEERWQSARDLSAQLRWLADGGAVSSAAPVQVPPRPIWKAATAVLGVAVVALGASYLMRDPQPPPAPISIEIAPPQGWRITTNTGSSPRVSPDGANVVFRCRTDNVLSLWVRPLDSFESRQLTGSEGASGAFWSPDSKSIGFFSGGKLKRVTLAGAPPQIICDSNGAMGAWVEESLIVFDERGKGLQKVSASGGVPTPVTTFDTAQGDTSHDGMFFFPDRKRFTFRIQSGKPDRGGIYLGSLDGAPLKRLSHLNGSRHFAGFSLLQREDALLAQRMDADSAELRGEPLLIHPNAQRSHASLSHNGTLAYVPRRSNGNEVLEVWDRTGRKISSIAAPGPGHLGHFELSPDGKRMAAEWNGDIYLFDIATGQPTRLTFDPAVENTAAWSPDGSLVYYHAEPNRLMRITSTGAGQPVVVAKDLPTHHKRVSPDGKTMSFSKSATPNPTFSFVRLDTGEKDKQIFPGDHVNFSPDGRWIAYTRSDGDTPGVYVESWPMGRGKWQVSRGGGAHPRWRSDGKELYFLGEATRTVFAAQVTVKGAVFESGPPKQFFERPGGSSVFSWYAASPDGQRFYLNAPVGGAEETTIRVIVNWAANQPGGK